MQKLNLGSHYLRFPTRRAVAKSHGDESVKVALSTAILILFLGAVIFAGVWVIAMHTGFIGAIGHSRTR